MVSWHQHLSSTRPHHNWPRRRFAHNLLRPHSNTHYLLHTTYIQKVSHSHDWTHIVIKYVTVGWFSSHHHFNELALDRCCHFFFKMRKPEWPVLAICLCLFVCRRITAEAGPTRGGFCSVQETPGEEPWELGLLPGPGESPEARWELLLNSTPSLTTATITGV